MREEKRETVTIRSNFKVKIRNSRFVKALDFFRTLRVVILRLVLVPEI